MLATVPVRERGTAPPAVALRWAEPSAGGIEVSAPHLLTTAVFDGSPAVPVTTGVHTHADGLPVWPHHGSLTLHTRDTVRRLVPGQGFWLPPGTPHDASTGAGSVSCYT